MADDARSKFGACTMRREEDFVVVKFDRMQEAVLLPFDEALGFAATLSAFVTGHILQDGEQEAARHLGRDDFAERRDRLRKNLQGPAQRFEMGRV